eukprot:scaffold657_cov108-Cylindrotheca_fusiformis.AAC.3
MKDKTTEEAQELVGYPEYSLIDRGTRMSPLEAWDPPSGQKKFTEQDLYDLFHNECIAFMGDSMDRRAADTLHVLMEYRHNTSRVESYIYAWENNHISQTRMVGDRKMHSYKKNCEPGTVDSVWAPLHPAMQQFQYSKNYSLIVASSGPWNYEKKNLTPDELVSEMNKTIRHLYHSIPRSVLIIWKTSAWSWYADWNFLERNEKTTGKTASNYLVYHGNQVAKQIIDKINASNLVYVDFAKEILPFSFSERRGNNMQAEFSDGNPWHLGPKARGLLLQMVANEVMKRRPFYNQTKTPETSIETGEQQEPSKVTSVSNDEMLVLTDPPTPLEIEKQTNTTAPVPSKETSASKNGPLVITEPPTPIEMEIKSGKVTKTTVGVAGYGMDEPNIAVVSQNRSLHILLFLVLAVIAFMRRSNRLKKRNEAMEAAKLIKEAPPTADDD